MSLQADRSILWEGGFAALLVVIFWIGGEYGAWAQNNGSGHCRYAARISFGAETHPDDPGDTERRDRDCGGLRGTGDQRSAISQDAPRVSRAVDCFAGAEASGSEAEGADAGGRGDPAFAERECGSRITAGGIAHPHRDRFDHAASTQRSDQKKRRYAERKSREGEAEETEEKVAPPPTVRRESRHVKTVESLCAKVEADKGARGLASQIESRERERVVKKRAVAMDRCVREKGGNSLESAELLHMEPTTIRRWKREWYETHFPLLPRGRPAERSSLEIREAILDTLYQLGPKTGVPVMQSFFPDVPRRELESMIIRFRRQYEGEDGKLAHELVWSNAGAVWAMDYTDPPAAIDDWYRDILAVRDLASGMEVEALPVRRETGKNTADALEALFIRHGAPLVIKRDNGGTLAASAVTRVLRRFGVEVLPSPAYNPEYNGSCEAGNGSLKTRAHHVASRHGRAGYWTCDDVEEARRLTNSSARPLGPQGPTPLQVWAKRKHITAKERRAFQKLVRENIKNAKEVAENSQLNDSEQTVSADTIRRRSVRRALESGGYLRYRRRNSSS